MSETASTNPAIALRQAISINKQTGERQQISFEILPAFTDDDGVNYFCPVRITGPVDEELNVGGIDSMQAVLLASETIRHRFAELQDSYDFLWVEGEQPMDSLDYKIT